jgi:transposase
MVEANVPFPDPSEETLIAAVLDTITPNTRLAVIDHIIPAAAEDDSPPDSQDGKSTIRFPRRGDSPHGGRDGRSDQDHPGGPHSGGASWRSGKSDDSEQARRLLAIAMIRDGVSRLDAARQAGMDRQTLRDWVHRYNEGGIDALVSRKPPGAVGKLTKEQMAELRELVIAGPDRKIHAVIRWRCVDLCAEVTRRFSVTVPERTIGKWLHKLKLTRLQPRPFHPKKDAAAQENFTKTSVPT